MYYFTCYIGESVWSSLELVSELLMIKAQLVQDGCLEVVAICFSAYSSVCSYSDAFHCRRMAVIVFYKKGLVNKSQP